jgi:beta-1,4-mannosyl-glycoprotein beta-1,4-N-acetylglucosaminyltransferase
MVHKPRIYDCFTFFNEMDILEIRLNELYPVVDTFVIVEATRLRSGPPKPLNFEIHKKRYERFLDKIRYVVVEDLPVDDNLWVPENFLRNAIVRGLQDCGDDDYVIVSDADEIPRASVVRLFDGDEVRFAYPLFYYYFNCKHDSDWQHPWSVMCKKRLLGRPNDKRLAHEGAPAIRDAGWHFSWLGGAEMVLLKLSTGCEFNYPPFTDIEHIRECMRTPKDLFNRPGFSYKFVDIDASFPEHLRAHQDRFAHHIHT